jgi:hypothetical protein
MVIVEVFPVAAPVSKVTAVPAIVKAGVASCGLIV